MQEDIQERKQALRLVGVAARIEKQDAEQQIGALWQRAAQSGQLPPPGEPVYAAYFDYEDRLAGAYRVLVGSASDAPLAAGQTEVVVPAGRYAVFHDEGAIPDVVQKLWQGLWTRWAGRERRGFRVDYEVYVGGPTHARVEIHLSSS